MQSIDESLYKKSNKTGRNDPCPCGSGKKYKKCCIDTGLYSTGSFLSVDEYNIRQTEENRVGSTGKEIWELNSSELGQLELSSLNPDQLKMALIRSNDIKSFDISISIIQELRKYYTANNGILYTGETKLIIEGQQIVHEAEEEFFDDLLFKLIIKMEDCKTIDMIDLIKNLYFDKDSPQYYCTQFYSAVANKDLEYILNYIEQFASLGIKADAPIIQLCYNIRKYYPGLAMMAFRSLISAFPDREYTIKHLIESYDEYREDLSIETFENLHDYLNEDDIYFDDDILYEMKQELVSARKESAKHKRLVEELKKQRSDDHGRPFIERKEIREEKSNNQEELIEQLEAGKRKIDHLKSIIQEKQEAIRSFKNNEQKNSISIEDLDVTNDDISDIEEDLVNHVAPKVLVPSYSKSFIKSIENENADLAKKAIVSLTGFTVNDSKILKQTKKLKALKSYYSIRVGIHHRLLVEYLYPNPPKAQYLIHRKDLEKYIKKIQQQANMQ